MTILTAFHKFESRFNAVKYIHQYKDAKGVCGILFQNEQTKQRAMFCFRYSVRGKMLSVNATMLEEARNEGIPIVIGVGERYFYLFTVADIEKENTLAEYDGVAMVSFPITSGRSMQKPKEKKVVAPKKSMKPIVEDNLMSHPLGQAINRELGPIERIA